MFEGRANMTLSYEKLVHDWSGSIAAILESVGWEHVPLEMAPEKQR